MKMVKACLPTIRLRFGAKPTFDALADELQHCSRIAYGLIEHQELHPPIAFIKPHMVGSVGVYRLKCIRFKKGQTDIFGGFWGGSRSLASMTAAEPYATENTYKNDTHDPD